jgi:hypothetical protein
VFAGGHVIEGNLIFNAVRETADHGAINVWDRQAYVFRDTSGRPTLIPAVSNINHNFLISMYNSIWPIDFDDGSSYWSADHNVCVYGGRKNYMGHNISIHDSLYIYPDVLRFGYNLNDYPNRWGTFCLEHSGNDQAQAGYDDEYYGNTCMLYTEPEIYNFDACNPSDMSNIPALSNNTYFVTAIDQKNVTIPCDNQQYTLEEWQSKTGQDQRSIIMSQPADIDEILKEIHSVLYGTDVNTHSNDIDIDNHLVDIQ